MPAPRPSQRSRPPRIAARGGHPRHSTRSRIRGI